MVDSTTRRRIELINLLIQFNLLLPDVSGKHTAELRNFHLSHGNAFMFFHAQRWFVLKEVFASVIFLSESFIRITLNNFVVKVQSVSPCALTPVLLCGVFAVSLTLHINVHV